MKSSELSNGENRIALRQLLQNRKWRQDNPIKTVGRDSFLSPKTPKNTSF